VTQAPISSNEIEVCDCRFVVPCVNDRQNGETQ
jgi:hypothetical protein